MKKAYSAGVIPAALLGLAGMVGAAIAQDTPATPTTPTIPGAESPAGAETPSSTSRCAELVAHLRAGGQTARIEEAQRASVEELLVKADQELANQNADSCMRYVNQAYEKAGIEVPAETPQAQ